VYLYYISMTHDRVNMIQNVFIHSCFDFIYYTQTRFTNEIDNNVLSLEIYGWCRILKVKNIVIISFFSFCIVFKRRRWIRQIYYLPTLTFFCEFIYNMTSCYLNSHFFFFLLFSRKNNKIVIVSKLLIGCMLYDHYDKNVEYTVSADKQSIPMEFSALTNIW